MWTAEYRQYSSLASNRGIEFATFFVAAPALSTAWNAYLALHRAELTNVAVSG